jgi:hypothetical protein
MTTMTTGEQAVWAAQFTQAQSEYFNGEMSRRCSEAKEGEWPLPIEEQQKVFVGAMQAAIEQAHHAVVLLRSVKPATGGDMLRQVLGRAERRMLPAPLDFLPEPFDRSMPPPNMMFWEGKLVCAVDDSGPRQMFGLEEAWKDHVDHLDPPGFVVAPVDGIPFGDDTTDREYEARLHKPDGGEILCGPQVATAAEARAFCWSCHEKPHHVSFWARFGEQTGTRMAAILEWTDAQLSEAWAYLQVRAEWDSKRPEPPAFWDLEE